MWPYTECEWNYITHGKKKENVVRKLNKFRKYKTLVLASTIPSLTLIWIISQLF